MQCHKGSFERRIFLQNEKDLFERKQNGILYHSSFYFHYIPFNTTAHTAEVSLS